MSTDSHNVWVGAFVLVAVGLFLARSLNQGTETALPRGPGLGHGVSLETAAAWDISIPPDGHNLPKGKGPRGERPHVWVVDDDCWQVALAYQ